MFILFKSLNEIIQVFTNSILLVSGKDINELTTVTCGKQFDIRLQ